MTPDAALPDPTQDRTILLARVGEGQMRMEALLSVVAQLRERVVELEAQIETLDNEEEEG